MMPNQWIALLALLAWLGALWLLHRKTAPRRFTEGVFAGGVLALAACGFYWRILFTNDAFMPAGGGDLVSGLYPYYLVASKALKSGLFPLWNPYVYSGAPFAANVESGIFYPLNLLFLLLTPQITYRSMMLLVIFHIWLNGLFMYVCLRLLRFEPEAPIGLAPALAGALAYMFSDFFIVHFGNLNLIAQATWFPLLFICLHYALRQNRWLPALLGGVILGIALVAGHIQPILLILLALGFYWLVHLLRTWREAGHILFVKAILLFPAMLVIGLCLAAPLLLPAVELGGLTTRADYSYNQASEYSLNPAQLIGLLAPGFFGRDPALQWGSWLRVEVGYLGILPLALAALALLLRRDRTTLFMAALALLSLLLALGGNSILHGWLFRFVPGFDRLRAAARFIFLLDFALAVLAAEALSDLARGLRAEQIGLLRKLNRLISRLSAVLGVVILPLAFYAILTNQDKDPTIFRRISEATNSLVFLLLMLLAVVILFNFYLDRRWSGRVFTWAAAALIFFDVASLGYNVDVGAADPSRSFAHPEAIEFLQKDGGLYRIDSRIDVWDVWQPGTGFINGIADIYGWINPLILGDYDRFLSTFGDLKNPRYNFLNTKYLIAKKDITLDWSRWSPVFDKDEKINIYLNRLAMPRFQLITSAIAVADHEEAFAALSQPDIDLARTVVVENGRALPGAGENQASIDIQQYSMNAIRLLVSSGQPAYLVQSEVFYPGWEARIDGEPAPVLRADYAFRAVCLTPGTHQVELEFKPVKFTIGLWICAVTIIILILFGILDWRIRLISGCP